MPPHVRHLPVARHLWHFPVLLQKLQPTMSKSSPSHTWQIFVPSQKIHFFDPKHDIHTLCISSFSHEENKPVKQQAHNKNINRFIRYQLFSFSLIMCCIAFAFTFWAFARSMTILTFSCIMAKTTTYSLIDSIAHSTHLGSHAYIAMPQTRTEIAYLFLCKHVFIARRKHGRETTRKQ